MSENEIKPVTRYELDTDGEGYSFGDAIPICREHPEGEWVAYAEHRWAIDRLREDLAEIRSQRDRAELLVEARGTCIARLTAERDAAVADARQLRDFVDVEKNALIAAASRARRCLAWACEQRPEFNAEYEALDAAIDAARSEGGV